MGSVAIAVAGNSFHNTSSSSSPASMEVAAWYIQGWASQCSFPAASASLLDAGWVMERGERTLP